MRLGQTLKKTFILFVFSLSSLSSFAQEEPVNVNPLKVFASVSPSVLGPGGNGQLKVEMELAETYHAYLDKFELKAIKPEGLIVGKFSITPVVSFFDSISQSQKRASKRRQL